MKHNLSVTFVLLLAFLLSQLFGLVTINRFIQPALNEATGEITITYPETAIGEVPTVSEEQKNFSFIPIMFALVAGTLLVLLFIRLKTAFLFRYWFLFAVFLSLFVSFGAYFQKYIALILAALLAFWKVFKSNVYVHNITEIFIYTGITLLFVGILNMSSAFILLVVISAYDMFAVWKSKHMVKLAKFQSKSKAFAGLFIPYSVIGHRKAFRGKAGKQKKQVKSAILGGGDMAFPLMFSSASMQYFIQNIGMNKISALFYTLIITFFVTLSLAALLFKSEKGKFYPAMPFLSIGCFVGWAVAMILI